MNQEEKRAEYLKGMSEKANAELDRTEKNIAELFGENPKLENLIAYALMQLAKLSVVFMELSMCVEELAKKMRDEEEERKKSWV